MVDVMPHSNYIGTSHPEDAHGPQLSKKKLKKARAAAKKAAGDNTSQNGVSLTQVKETTVLDPDGDVMLILSCPSIPIRETDDFETASHQGSDTELLHHFLASSRHLTLSSPVLKEKIGSETPKSPSPTREPQIVRLSEHDDEEAAKLALNIIHNLHVELPHSLDITRLAKLAAFVQRYGMEKSTVFMGRTWMRDSSPEDVDLMNGDEASADGGQTWSQKDRDWLFVSFVWGNADVFRRYSRRAMLYAVGRVDEGVDFDRPNGEKSVEVLSKIADAIDDKRQVLVDGLFKILDDFMALYSDFKRPRCVAGNQYCDSGTLGMLIHARKEAAGDESRELWSKPAPPFEGLCYSRMRNILSRTEFHPCRQMDCRGPGEALAEALEKHDQSEDVVGLELKDFVEESNRELLKEAT